MSQRRCIPALQYLLVIQLARFGAIPRPQRWIAFCVSWSFWSGRLTIRTTFPPLQPFLLSSVVGRLKDAMPCCLGILILHLIRRVGENSKPDFLWVAVCHKHWRRRCCLVHLQLSRSGRIVCRSVVQSIIHWVSVVSRVLACTDVQRLSLR